MSGDRRTPIAGKSRARSPSALDAEYRRLARRVLALLSEAGSSIERRGDTLVHFRSQKAVGTACGMPSGVLAELLEAGAVRCLSRLGKSSFVITDAGLARLRREEAEADPFASQHQVLVDRQAEDDDGGARVRVNIADDPLEILRRCRALPHLLGPAEFEAGLRLKQDFLLARTMPSTTTNWSRLAVDGIRQAGGMAASEMMVEARGRIDRALDAVGPDLAGVLWDVCGDSKGLEAIERDNVYPARSGKLALAYALRSLMPCARLPGTMGSATWRVAPAMPPSGIGRGRRRGAGARLRGRYRSVN